MSSKKTPGVIIRRIDVTNEARDFVTRRPLAALSAVLVVAFSSAFALTAQSPAKKVLGVEDYTRWRAISASEISGDGNWVAYGVSQTNTAPADAKPVQHLLNLTTNQDVAIPDGSGGSFSADSQWFAYQVDPGGGRGGRGGRGGANNAPAAVNDTNPPAGGQGAQARGGATTPPIPPRHVELRNLTTGAVQSWQDIQSFTFSTNSTYLLLRRRPANANAGRGGANGGAADPNQQPNQPPAGGAGANAQGNESQTGPRGADVTLHNLATGRDQLLGSVGDIAFNKSGELLAYTVDAAVKDSNGLFVLDLRSGRVNSLDNDAKSYNRLTWSDDGAAVAVLKGVDVDKMRERSNVLIAFPNVQTALGEPEPAPIVLDPTKAAGFPSGWVVSDRAALEWSDDDKRVFFGMKAQIPAVDTTTRRPSTDERADVDVWNSLDERIQSVQMIRADADRNFTFREAFDVSAAKYVKLADETMRELDVAQDGRWAVGRDTRGYISDYKRPAADFYRVNTTTGERTLMMKNQLTGAGTIGISPDGHYFLYWKDNKFQAYDLDAGTSRTLGGASAVSFVDTQYDHPGPKPSYGIAGYTSDGKSVIVQHQYDLWAVPFDGSAARNLTNGLGAKNEVRYRYVRMEPDDAAPGGAGGGGRGGRGGGARGTIDLSKPVTFSTYGEWTKKAGFSQLVDGQMKELVYDDAAYSTPVKAAKADKFLFTRQTFVEFPDLRVSGPDLKDAKKITDINPQQAEYMWGHRILFDFKNKDGLRLQGILALPDDYKPGEKRPMIVNFYEENSQNLNRYSAPSYLTGMGSSPIQAVSEGYITMLPDIHYRTGASHSDMLECVEAAVRKVIETGYVDPKRIGINGHSYGGEGAAFIGTRSRLFAAVGVGAGVTDLYFDFNQNWGWSYQVSGGSGANGNDYYLYGQGREAVSPWDNPEMYNFESALTHVREVTAPILIMHGTADPTVAFQNGLAFYNALRYNGKNAILLAYPGEGHGLRGMANRKDLTIRYFQFFDHYLKDGPAPKWMTEGVPFIEKDIKRDPTIK
jgi:dipeptidyl aminopeptidase/acylaminoacyl peptidase